MNFPLFPLRESTDLPLDTENTPRLLLVRSTAGSNPETDGLLANILKALKLDQQTDSRTLALSEEPRIHLPDALKTAKISRCVVFGYTPRQMGTQWQWPLYQPLTRQNRHYLFAAQLNKIGKNAKHKRALWESLQTLMNL